MLSSKKALAAARITAQIIFHPTAFVFVDIHFRGYFQKFRKSVPGAYISPGRVAREWGMLPPPFDVADLSIDVLRWY